MGFATSVVQFVPNYQLKDIRRQYSFNQKNGIERSQSVSIANSTTV